MRAASLRRADDKAGVAAAADAVVLAARKRAEHKGRTVTFPVALQHWQIQERTKEERIGKPVIHEGTRSLPCGHQQHVLAVPSAVESGIHAAVNLSDIRAPPCKMDCWPIAASVAVCGVQHMSGQGIDVAQCAVLAPTSTGLLLLSTSDACLKHGSDRAGGECIASRGK